jgi:hypothetical protein
MNIPPSREPTESLATDEPNSWKTITSRRRNPDFKQRSRHSRKTNLNYAEKYRWKKSTRELHNHNLITDPQTNHYLRKDNMDKEGPRHIPTIVSGKSGLKCEERTGM